jgi:hypothetical protein
VAEAGEKKVDGTVAPENFANKLNAPVKAQTAALAVFTIRRDKASIVLGENTWWTCCPSKYSQTRQWLLTEQHSWVEEANSRTTFRRKIKDLKGHRQKIDRAPTFDNRINSYSVNVSSWSFPGWQALGRMS